MFGKSEWFKDGETRKRPATWSGYAYLAGWSGVVAVPTIYLLQSSLDIEALIWLATSLLAFGWDWRAMHRSPAVSAVSKTGKGTNVVETGIRSYGSTETPAATSDEIVFLDRPKSALESLKGKFDYYVKKR